MIQMDTRSGQKKLDKKIRLRLPVLLGIRLHPKTSDSVRLRLRNPHKYSMFFSSVGLHFSAT